MTDKEIRNFYCYILFPHGIVLWQVGNSSSDLEVGESAPQTDVLGHDRLAISVYGDVVNHGEHVNQKILACLVQCQ